MHFIEITLKEYPLGAKYGYLHSCIIQKNTQPKWLGIFSYVELIKTLLDFSIALLL